MNNRDRILMYLGAGVQKKLEYLFAPQKAELVRKHGNCGLLSLDLLQKVSATVDFLMAFMRDNKDQLAPLYSFGACYDSFVIMSFAGAFALAPEGESPEKVLQQVLEASCLPKSCLRKIYGQPLDSEDAVSNINTRASIMLGAAKMTAIVDRPDTMQRYTQAVGNDRENVAFVDEFCALNAPLLKPLLDQGFNIAEAFGVSYMVLSQDQSLDRIMETALTLSPLPRENLNAIYRR